MAVHNRQDNPWIFCLVLLLTPNQGLVESHISIKSVSTKTLSKLPLRMFNTQQCFKPMIDSQNEDFVHPYYPPPPLRGKKQSQAEKYLQHVWTDMQKVASGGLDHF